MPPDTSNWVATTKDALKDAALGPSTEHRGRVEEIGDGVAMISGLRDVRLDDAEDEARRASARSVGLDAVFAKGAAAAVAPPPTAIEMPEGSLREMRLEDEGRVAAQAAGVEALVDQALQSGRGGARSGKTKKAGNEASSASRSAGAAPGCSGSSAVHAGPPELS